MLAQDIGGRTRLYCGQGGGERALGVIGRGKGAVPTAEGVACGLGPPRVHSLYIGSDGRGS